MITTTDNLVLFLDFDGVLHPELSFSHETLSQLPLVEVILREYPSVDIVISSNWRLDGLAEHMLSHFSQDIAPRVIGVTPSSARLSGDLAPLPYPREDQCLSWLKSNRPAWMPWMALDDRDWWFSPGCPNLVKVDGSKGFTPSDEEPPMSCGSSTAITPLAAGTTSGTASWLICPLPTFQSN